jgi:hypothetical protein
MLEYQFIVNDLIQTASTIGKNCFLWLLDSDKRKRLKFLATVIKIDVYQNK